MLVGSGRLDLGLEENETYLKTEESASYLSRLMGSAYGQVMIISCDYLVIENCFADSGSLNFSSFGSKSRGS